MADLTIKPQAGSSNKLILQDQQGGTVLETATSGATLGNNTQDNITRLGTVTSGSIAGGTITNATTFPAGHIIQVQALSSNTRSTTGSNTWNSKWSKTLAITPVKASSNIWLSASFTAYVNHHSAYFDFYKNASDVTETYNLSGLTYGCADIQTGVNWLGMCITFLDTCTENSTSEKTYSFSGRHSNTGGTLYLGGGDNAGVTLTLMEIAT